MSITKVSKEDEMLTEHVSSVIKLALKTFKSRPEVFSHNIDLLRRAFSKTRAHHVNLNPMFMKESTWKTKDKAPMTYIGIYQDDVINMGIFILKQNMRLPLHNHPNMYGLLKVIAGTVNVKSFSIKTEKKIEEQRLLVSAERNPDMLVDEESDCCFLDPIRGNLHEIETVGGPAAFVDILSPPYETDIGTSESRKCSYFRVKSQSGSLFQLEEMSLPSWFWSDSYPYEGPQPNIQI